MFKKREEKLKKYDLRTVQKFYEMKDYNKSLKLNSLNREQLAKACQFEKLINETIKKLYVPDYN